MRPDIRFVPLDEVGAGAALAQALLDAHGTMLLPKDARLTETILATLRRRGIAAIPLADAGRPAAMEAEAVANTHADADIDIDAQAEKERTRERMHHLFRHGGRTAADQAFMQLATSYRLQKRK